MPGHDRPSRVLERWSRVAPAIRLAFNWPCRDPYRLLAIAVVASAYCDNDSVDRLWVEIADLEPDRLGVLVEAA